MRVFLPIDMIDTRLALTTVDQGVPWRDTQWPGISWCLLASDSQGEPARSPSPHFATGEGSGGAAGKASRPGSTVLIRMAPGCGYPTHLHLGIEDVLVLAGGYRDELGEYGVGAFVRYPAGSRHSPVALGETASPEGPSNPACILFASARGGIELNPAPTES